MEWMLLALLVAAHRISCSSAEENWPWSPNATNVTPVKRVVEGSDVVLRCAGRLEDASAHWEFKPCGPGMSPSNCSLAQYVRDGWETLEGQITGRLGLLAVGPRNQGLYRCRQSATSSIHLHSAVRLEVILSTQLIDVELSELSLPIFLEGLPHNLTVDKDSQAIFQCKVYSRTPLRLWWMAPGWGSGSTRQQQPPTPMQGAGELHLSEQIYVSKMVLPKARARDAGRYYCVAANTKGYTNSSAYLEVVGDTEDEWYELNGDGWSLYLLFLLPLGLAAGPALLWGCYAWRKRAGRPEEENQEEGLYL